MDMNCGNLTTDGRGFTLPIMQNVVLVGPMGAGKSTIGRSLALMLQRQFFDSDEEIERRTGVDIPTIFEIEGEDGFRARETEVLRDLLLSGTNRVIATGGGVVMRAVNREMLKEHCVVYLRVPVAEQHRRTRRRQNRPLLRNVENPRARLEELFRVRDPLYTEVATWIIRGRYPQVRDAVLAVCQTIALSRPDLCPAHSHKALPETTIVHAET